MRAISIMQDYMLLKQNGQVKADCFSIVLA